MSTSFYKNSPAPPGPPPAQSPASSPVGDTGAPSSFYKATGPLVNGLTAPVNYTPFGVLYGNGLLSPLEAAPGTDNQVFTGTTGGAPLFKSPAALTEVNDTNVTLALGGTPALALLKPVSLTLGWTGTLAAARLNANVVQGVVSDTNINGAISAQTLTLSWAGTLAAARLNSNVVQGVTNDTNITGSITGQNLTFAWAGTLAAARLNANVVQAITNDTNVTGSITAQNLTLAWSGTLSLLRGGTGSSTAAGARTNLGVTATGADTTYAFRANNLSDLASAPTARTNLGLGTAATLNVGTGANNVVQLNASSQLPAVDGSLLTGLAGSTPTRGAISGLILSRISASNLGISVGSCTSDDATTLMTMTTGSAQKNVTLGFTAGLAGNGSLDTGSIAAGTWYQVYLIENTGSGAVDVLTSLSFGSPTMPTGFNKKRWLGAFLSDGSSQITNFLQVDNEILWAVPFADVSNFNLTTTSTLFTLAVPPGTNVWAIFNAIVSNNASGILVTLQSPDQTTMVTNTPGGNVDMVTGAAGTVAAGRFMLRTNTSKQIRAVSNLAAGVTGFYVVTHGYRISR